MRRALLLATAILALPGLAASAPPTAGVLVPGRSLGELQLGIGKAQVERAWGRAYGICGNCSRETWYFNYFAFQPRGVGVEFRAGRAVALFTLHSPTGWHTPKGLTVGDGAAEVTALYGPLKRIGCDGYYALVLERRGSRTAFYVLRERLWAFGLSRTAVPVCRD